MTLHTRSAGSISFTDKCGVAINWGSLYGHLFSFTLMYYVDERRGRADETNSLPCVTIGWDEEKNDLMPFIKYMLRMILACYLEFEQRVTMTETSGRKSTAYNVVKEYASGKVGKFTGRM